MTILIVDDNELNLYQLQVLLRGNGYQVVTAVNGAEALTTARQNPPDLIISDILMPVMDGFTLCDKWKKDERLREIPFVFYTATYTDERDREFALSLGSEQFLVKPEEPEVFIRIIREVIQQVQRPPAPPAPPAANTPARLPVEEHPRRESGYLKQYNEVLIRKLEGKIQQLEQADRKLERDITERKRATEELQRSFDQLRALAARLQSIREEERKRVAREIHDQLGQALTAIKIDLSSWVRELPAGEKQPSKRTASILELVDETIQSVRRIATELRPRMLDDLGLVATVEWAAEEFEARTGTKCRLELSHDDIVIDQERATAIFRILQETLTNVARHADATEVEVRLVKEEGDLSLAVHDNGRGIPEEKLSNGSSLGILGMRERAVLLGGELTISGAPGKGTTLRVRIPEAHHTERE